MALCLARIRYQANAARRPTAGTQANFERNSDNGAFEEQYRKLCDQIQTIYDGAKEFHQHGWVGAAGWARGPGWEGKQRQKANDFHPMHRLSDKTRQSTPPPRIDLLIRDFKYHVVYKRWNDTFSAVPFKPANLK